MTPNGAFVRYSHNAQGRRSVTTLIAVVVLVFSGCLQQSPVTDTSSDVVAGENAHKATPAEIRDYEFDVAVLVDRIYTDLVSFTTWLDAARNATENNTSDEPFEALNENLTNHSDQVASLVPPKRYQNAHTGLNDSLGQLSLLYEAGYRCARNNNTTDCNSLPEYSDSFFQLIDEASQLGRLRHWISAYVNYADHDWTVEVATDVSVETFTARANVEQEFRLEVPCSSVMSHVTVTVLASNSQNTSESFRRSCGNELPYFITISENDWGEVYVQHLQDPEN